MRRLIPMYDSGHINLQVLGATFVSTNVITSIVITIIGLTIISITIKNK